MRGYKVLNEDMSTLYGDMTYELNKEYGWSKFIVMVPSIAIREGVQKSFDITQDYFQELYHKKIRYFVYNSNNSWLGLSILFSIIVLILSLIVLFPISIP